MTKNFLFKNTTLFLLVILSPFFHSCNGDDEDIEPETTQHQFMSLNLNGQELEGLLNASFGAGLPNSTSTLIHTSNSEEKYLWLQGHHNNCEINIFINEDHWQENSSCTLEQGTFPSSGSCFINLIDANFNFDFDLEGEFTITEFDLVNKVFKGTFSFSSPTNNATGTLDYPLDHEDFQ